MSLTTPSIFAVGVLISTTLCLELTSRPRQELLSECVCWSLILIFGQAYFYFRSKPSRSFNTSNIAIIAFGATLLCLTCTFQRMTWSLAPLVPPALIIIERKSASLPEYEHPEVKDTSSNIDRKNVILCLYAAVTIIALCRDDPFQGLHLKLCWIFSQIVLYWGLSNRVSQLNGIKFDDMVEVWHTATELSGWMALITIPLAVLWWHHVPSIPQIGMFGFLKACRWISVLVLAHESRLTLIAWTTIFAICTKAVWVYASGWQTAFEIFGALAALHRVATAFPSSSLGKYLVLAFSVLPLWAFGLHTDFARITIPSVRAIDTTWAGAHHPIYHLHEEAKDRFEKTQQRQSRSLSDAVTEYRRRYGRAPPPGFDQWYEFAVENDVQWIDEYDFLTKSLDPFWKMPPRVLREYVDQVSSLPGEARFNTLEIKNHQLSLSNGNQHQHTELHRLLKPVLDLVPDLKAVLNEPDEPRVLIPYSELHGEDSSHEEPPNAQTQPLYFGRQEWQIIWDSVTLPCSPESRARSARLEAKVNDFMPPFISNLTESQDICSMPATAGTQHGFLSSPSTFHYTQHLVPVLSTSKISTFQDIMMPSSAYFQDGFAGYDELKDVPWDQKKDPVYWRGSGTGGHWTKGSWKMGHRQRFVNFTNFADAEIRLLKESSEGTWTAYKAKMSEQQQKFNVKFTGFIQCDEEDCKEQEEYFHKAERDHNEDANQYKILYNVDGNSFSGRYYRFLKSNCLVFQQELFKEWHDDRLVPWLHFVPIGLSMEELPETTRYLLDDPEGKVVAASIAGASRDWSRRVLREVDATAAYYRVFLEYARLMDDDRDALS